MSRDLFEYHPVIGYRFIPQLKARVRHEGGGYLVRTNSLGFRQSAELSSARLNGHKRVLVFGDSYTAGDGVSNNYRYTDLIERSLDNVEIVNFGLPGSGTDQQYLSYLEYAKDVQADLLVIAPMVENIVRNPVSHRLTMNSTNGKLVRRAKPYYELTDGELMLKHSPVPKAVLEVAEEVKDDSKSPGFLQRVTATADERFPGFKAWTQRVRGITWPPEYNSEQDPAWQLMREIIVQWTHQSNIPVALCPIPTFAHIQGGITADPYLKRFAEVARATNATLINPLPHFLSLPYAQRNSCRFLNDEHPNKRGHEILANSIGAEIKKILKL